MPISFILSITNCHTGITWKIAPDCTKKVIALKNLNWKEIYGSQISVHADYAKSFYHRLVFYMSFSFNVV